jgi:hypothetical protein
MSHLLPGKVAGNDVQPEHPDRSKKRCTRVPLGREERVRLDLSPPILHCLAVSRDGFATPLRAVQGFTSLNKHDQVVRLELETVRDYAP